LLRDHPPQPVDELAQPLLGHVEIRARRPEAVRQAGVHVDFGAEAGFLQQLSEQQRLVAARVQAADGKVRLVGDVGVRVEEQRGEALVLGRSAVFGCACFVSWMIIVLICVNGDKNSMDVTHPRSSQSTSSSTQARP